MRIIHLAIRYLIYLIKARNEHSVHSPFVFELVTQVIYNKNNYYAYEEIEKQRDSLLLNSTTIEVADKGAKKGNYNKKIKKIAATSLKSKKYGKLIFRLVNHFQPKNIVELGTSLGITTAYMAKANPQASITSIEGAPEVAGIAGKTFKDLDIQNVKQIVGNFDDVLEHELDQFTSIDLAFFDGNHQKKATLHYFNICLKKKNTDSVFIFDDIYWSPGMTEAWEEIKKHPEVSVTVDLFELGLVFFRSGQVKQDFIIRF